MFKTNKQCERDIKPSQVQRIW